MQAGPGPTNLKHKSREITTGPARTPAAPCSAPPVSTTRR